MKILIINGINLHNIGSREPQIYGNENFDDYFQNLKSKFNFEIDYFQSNYESKIVEKIIFASNSEFNGIVLNAGAFSHTSVAIRDAISATEIPVVLIHISNTYKREIFRQQELIAPVCKGIITGFGLKSYELGIMSLMNEKLTANK
ncbi:MAG: 3-dehydroquinate dehydratase [Bacteroidales bacterium]|jgi:3-dehydroquinate dehydratase-2|nr:3-dehydroquinate dehydratase [Bacteroidales bacterium]